MLIVFLHYKHTTNFSTRAQADPPHHLDLLILPWHTVRVWLSCLRPLGVYVANYDPLEQLPVDLSLGFEGLQDLGELL